MLTVLRTSCAQGGPLARRLLCGAFMAWWFITRHLPDGTRTPTLGVVCPEIKSLHGMSSRIIGGGPPAASSSRVAHGPFVPSGPLWIVVDSLGVLSWVRDVTNRQVRGRWLLRCASRGSHSRRIDHVGVFFGLPGRVFEARSPWENLHAWASSGVRCLGCRQVSQILSTFAGF